MMENGVKRAGRYLSILLICILGFSSSFAQTCAGDPNSLVLDDDFDGYKNGDETQNGTDKCSSLSYPADSDMDFLSDLLDTDDDNDGISDSADKFAQDKDNGTTTNIPVYYKFQNPTNGGICNSGFTGLMHNGSNYGSLYTPAEIVIGGPTNKFIVNNIPVGDALAASNSQKNGFQFGVNAGAFPFNYTISSRVMAPFAAIIPTDFQSMGMYMGNGDQDNYLKIACVSNGGVGGIEVVKEVGGVVTSNMYSASILGASQVNFYFTVNRAANTVQPAYSKNGGAVVNVGSAIAVPSSWLSNVLAVGIISTSRGADPFSASWDNIAVQPIAGNGQWNTINTNNSCIPRHDCGFVENGSRFFLLGGHGVTGFPTEYYNYSSKTWFTGADVRDATPPIPLHHFQAVQIRGMIYFGCAFTGETPNDVPADNIYFYDPPYNLYHVGREIPEDRRRGAAAAVAHNEKIYFIGGLKTGHNAGWTNYLDVYDPYTNTWTILPDAPHERDHFQAVVHDGKIYCIGGRKSGFGGSTYAETVVQTDVYDIEEQTWTTLPSPECDIPTPRAGASVAIIGDEIFVIGGENMSQTAALKTTEAFNVKTKTWRTLANMNTGRHGTQAIVNNYAIYMVGGVGNRGESPDLSSMEVFYPYGTTTPSGTAYTKGVSAQLPDDNVSFGQVPIGTTSTKSVWLKNTGGTQAMVITKIQVAANSTNFYSVTYPYPTPYTVNPGDSTKIQVTFRPNSTGNISGTLYTSNTLTDADNTSFGLTGTGVTQQSAVRINCEGPQFTAASSDVFAEDFFNLPGTTEISTSQSISGTTDDVLYQTMRSGSAFSYNIPVQNNTYTVKLHFAEIASNAVAGINVFDVKIENSTKITALDLFTTAGINTAHTRTFTIAVTDQMMNLDFIASAGNARVSAIELIPAAVTQGILTSVPMPVEFPETDLNSASAPMTVTLTNTGTSSLNITGVNITGTNAANFIHTYGVNPTTLPPGSTNTFTVTFTPTTSGLKTAMLNVSNTGMNTTLNIPLKGTGSSTAAPCGYFVEQNGLLVMEVESHKPTGYWAPGTSIPNYTGTEYYTWQGPNYFFEKGTGLMRYEFKITNPGKYRFRLRSRHPGPDPTHFNDIWVRFPDHGATFEKNGQVMQESGTGWWIMSMATADAWTYNSWGLRSTYWEIFVEFKDPGIYYVDLSGRVEYFSIDRMVLYKMDQYTEWQACGSNPPQSPWENCPATSYTWYRDKDLDDYGDPDVSVQAIKKPGTGWIWNNDDCNDNHAESYPGAPEVLDGRDNDCDGVVDDGAVLDALNINCGGSIYTAVNGDEFESDRLYKPSNSSTKFFNNIGDILNTDDDALFKSERVNSAQTTTFSYNLKADPGKFYKVSLYFAEQGTVVNPGERVFKVLMEDSVVLNNFDIIATVGYKTAYVYEGYVYLRDSELNIKFVDITGKAKVNAIKAAIQPNVPPTFKVQNVYPTHNEDFTGTKFVNVLPDSVMPNELSQVVTYSLSPASVPFANVVINPATGQVSITSVPNGNGLQVFTIIANDGQAENNIATKTFQLRVIAVNDKPTFTMSGNVNVNKNFLGTIDVTATPGPVPTDEQSQVVTYSLSPASVAFANVSINSATGKVSINSISEMYGTQIFTVTANDGMSSNNTHSQTFTLTVNNLNNAPTLNAIADVTINEDDGMQTVNFSGITAGIGENQLFTVNVSSDNVALIPTPSLNYSFPNSNGSLSFTPVADKSGIAHITVSVTDATLTTSKTFMVNVNAINDAPVFTLSSNAVSVSEDFSGAQEITVIPGYVPDEEMSQIVTYNLAPSSVAFANVSINSSTGKVTITAVANGNGSQMFTVIANDGQSQNNIVSQTFMLTVNSLNDSPTFSMSSNISVNEDFATTEVVSVIPGIIPTDEISQVVTYSISPASISFANISIDSATGEVTVTSVADAFGSQLFTVTAGDGQSQNNLYSQTFTLTVNAVNDAPVFTLNGDVTVSEDFANAQHVIITPGFVPTDEMSQVVSYSLSPAFVSFANVSINSSTGEVTITSVADVIGSQLFTVTADDAQSQNNLYSQTFTLTVNAVNDAPVFVHSGDVSVNEDFISTEIVSMSLVDVPADEVSQTVTYSLSPASVSFANISFNAATGRVAITSVANASGSQIFTVIANDGQAQNNSSSQTFTLTVNSVNDAPAFVHSGDISVNEDFITTEIISLSLVGVPADEAGQTVTYSLSPASVSFANISFDSYTGEVSIASIFNANGSQLFTVAANDGQSQNNSYSQTFMLTVNAVNDAPDFTLSGDINVIEGIYTSATETVYPGFVPADEMSQTVSYSIAPASVSFANISINSSTGEVTITPVADQFGSQLFTIIANDGQSMNNTYSQTFMLTVEEGNNPPSFTLSGDVSADEDFAVAQNVTVSPDPVRPHEAGQIVTYSLSPASVSFANISFNSSTGEVVVTSIANLYGSQQFTITAHDGQSRNNIFSETFMLTVNPVNDAPVFTLSGDVSVDEDFSTTEHITIAAGFVPSNEISQIVTYSLSPASVSFANASINNVTGEVSITSVADASGSQLFTITADDGQPVNNISSQTFMLTVNAVNDQPTLNVIANPGAIQEDSGTHTVNLSGISAGGSENQPLTVTAVSDNLALLPMLNVNYVSPASAGSITFQPAPNQWGSATVTVTVNDGQVVNNTISQTFIITVTPVNDAPKFSMTPSYLTLNEDFAGTQTVFVIPYAVPADEASQAVTYSLSPASVPFANIAFNSATGEMQITAIPNMNGSRTLTISANDGQSQNNTHSEIFVLSVTSINDAPVFTVNSSISVFKNFTTTETVAVTPAPVPSDETAQTVTYALSPASVSFANVSFNIATGTVEFTSIANMTGTQMFTITANDGQAANHTHSAQFLFSVMDTNYQPTLDVIIDMTINEDASMQTVNLSGITPGFNENQLVTVSATSSNPVLIPNLIVSYSNPNTVGLISYAPAADMNGIAVITVKVDDGQNNNHFITRYFTVTVNSVNDAPALDAIADITINEDALMQNVTLTGVSAGYHENQALSVIAVSDNPFLIANPLVTYNNPDTHALLQFLPVANQSGTAVITVSVDDAQSSNNLFTKSFTVIVLPINDAPFVSDVYKYGQEEKSIGFAASNFTDEFSDIENDTLAKIQIISLPLHGTLLLHLQAVNMMDEISINDISNLVYDPANEFSGIDSFLWSGTDGKDYSAINANVYLNVNDVNDKPFVVTSAADIKVDEDAPAILNHADFTKVFDDVEDGTNMTFSIYNSNPSLLNAVIDTNQTVDVIFNANAHGDALIVISAIDHAGASIADTFNVSVNSVEDIPSLFSLLTPADGSILENPTSIDFTWENSTDGDGDAISYTITIKGYQLDTIIVVPSSSLLFNSSRFTKDSVYTWLVTASDGDDMTSSMVNNFKISDATAVHDPYAPVSDVNAFPNPFSEKMLINYSLKIDAQVIIKIMNFLGQEIITLTNEHQTKGKHAIEWNSSEAASGVYFFQLLMETNGRMEGEFIGKVVKE